MSTLTTYPTQSNRSPDTAVSFDTVVAPFLQAEGLPFADVLSAADIEQAFAVEDALFAQKDIFSTPIVLWAFLAQSLRDGKQCACRQAVSDIRAYLLKMGRLIPSPNTGDYCRARVKLSPLAVRRLGRHMAEELERRADPSWLWHGMAPKLVDGFTFTMMDTEDNQAQFPQLTSQAPGIGFPIARACAILSLTTAAIHDLALGPYEGKETGETALLRQMLDNFGPGDLGVFDRYYCSYMMIGLLHLRGAHVCARLHQCRKSDFRRGKRLSEGDHIVTWTRPKRPDWMPEALYAQIPETLTLREIQFDVTEPHHRPAIITVVTTLIDPETYPKEDIAELYNYRWNVELDIRAIKNALNLKHVLCKSPRMVALRLRVALLGYNLIRKLIAAAALATSEQAAAEDKTDAGADEDETNAPARTPMPAPRQEQAAAGPRDDTAAPGHSRATTPQRQKIAAKTHRRQPRELSFTGACQSVLSSWVLLSTGACRDARRRWECTMQEILASVVANRPGRVEPRVLKRRRHGYPLMNRPRQQLRKELTKT